MEAKSKSHDKFSNSHTKWIYLLDDQWISQHLNFLLDLDIENISYISIVNSSQQEGNLNI